ncbi:TonB-dependent receptor [Sphingomonas sp.]|uniref:TonB-dependent receptor plug domain-containing protein n=1 Tax=Sphingomonas sp. TaxID=28214 RepID=UPI001ECBEC9E|nr:TonB-dependent receptor [Sphingomonas sp.]MBX3593941.1 TonB-dependent receptor [Sphingomonas sp.]
MKHIRFVPALLLAGAAATPAWAQTVDPDGAADQDLIVTGTRADTAIPVGQTGGAVTVLDSAALEERQTRMVADILRDVPGVAVARVPGQTQIRLRGTEANQVLVLIDGIEVSDPFTGEFDLGTLPADAGGRIEVLRGQQSAIYGSDAIGGVIHYITATGREMPGLSARIEAGSLGTVNGAVRAAGGGDVADYALTATLNTMAGTSNARTGGRDLRDDTGAIAFKGNWQPGADARITAVARYSHSRQDFNDTDSNPASPTFGYVVDTPGNHVESEGLYALLRGTFTLLDGRWSHSVSGQIADTRRDGYNAAGRSYGDVGTRLKGSYETTLTLGGAAFRQLFTVAADVERERYRNTDPTGFAFTGARHVSNVGIVAQYEARIGERGAFGASLRHDANDLFDDTTTYRLQGSYRFASGTRLRAAAGSGVKNPGFYELYGYIDGRFIGNSALKPERSEGWEAGIEQQVDGGGIVFGTTYFQSVLRDEIYTSYPAPTYVATPANSTGRSRQHGVEAYVNARLGAGWRIDGAYTWLHARERGAEEVRRPPHSASLAVNWSAPDGRVSVNAVVRYTGVARDLAYIDPSYVPVRVRLDDYALVNLAAEWRVTRTLSVFARGDNLLDARYESVFSFTNPGITGVAGMRARF